MKKDLIIGSNGMIGKAIYECYGDDKNKVLKQDLECIYIDNEDTIRCMHICIPCKAKNKFIDIVINYIKEHNPEIVILHSTVPVGTSREIYKQTKNVILVHSPCCGKHPNLYVSIKSASNKFFSVLPKSEKIIRKVEKIMIDLFDYPIYVENPENTETAKILSTTEYALHIAIVTEFKRYCKENNLNFDFVYTAWRENYNETYTELKDKKFIRPILTPCKGKISGHCILPNIQLIKKYMKSTWLTDIKPKRLIK